MHLQQSKALTVKITNYKFDVFTIRDVPMVILYPHFFVHLTKCKNKGLSCVVLPSKGSKIEGKSF